MKSTRAEAYKCKDISGACSPSGKPKYCISWESKSRFCQVSSATENKALMGP